MFIFPGIGLASIISGCKTVTNEMFYAASKALAGCLSHSDLQQGRIYPPVDGIRDVTARVAAAVILQALEEGQAPKLSKGVLGDLEGHVRSKMWYPDYQPIVFNPYHA